MNTLFAPARFLFSLFRFDGRFYLLIGLSALLAAASLFDAAELRVPIALVLGALIIYLPLAVSQSMVANHANLRAELGCIGSGDLSIAATNTARHLRADAMNTVIERARENLAGIVSQVRDTSSVIVDAMTELRTGNQSLSERTEHQASTLEPTAAGMEELSVTVEQNSANAQAASKRADHARSVSTMWHD